jgi:hypothetical protein
MRNVDQHTDTMSPPTTQVQPDACLCEVRPMPWHTANGHGGVRWCHAGV